jgi:opacity protein-like surface antigen
MKKSVCVLAVLAAAVSTSAVAKDLKQNKQAPAVSATQMTNSEMDKVTAGAGQGNAFAFGKSDEPAWFINNGKAVSNGNALLAHTK